MTVAAIEFKTERAFVTDKQLHDWSVRTRNQQGLPIEIGGDCPVCTHDTTGEIKLTVRARAMSGATGSLPARKNRITRVVECECGHEHPQPPSVDAASTPIAAGTESSCGRWWLVSVSLDPTAPTPVRAGDQTLLDAARAVQAAAAGEETRIRASAEKWIAGVTALLGLFSISGIVFSADALDGLPAPATVVAAGLAATALFLGSCAIKTAYKAAYGWPVPVDLVDDEKLLEWYDEKRRRVATAADDLRHGVGLAGWAVGCLGLAVAVVWLWPRSAPMPLVQATLDDDSFVCGHLLASEDDAPFRIRRADGTVTSVDPAAVSEISLPRECP